MNKSQPLDSKLFNDLNINNLQPSNKKVVEKQYMGEMFSKEVNIKVTVIDRLQWLKRDLCHFFYDIKYIVRNYFKWAKTIASLRPWDGWENGILVLIKKHLEDYVDTEIKYGNSEENYKQNKINTAQECINLLEKLQNYLDYSTELLEPIYAKYPKYKQLVTKYPHSTSYNGLFVKQDRGWVGEESGSKPRRGYFEFKNDVLELCDSPNLELTQKLLTELDNYTKEISNAYKLSDIQYMEDKKRMTEILRDFGPQWWD